MQAKILKVAVFGPTLDKPPRRLPPSLQNHVLAVREPNLEALSMIDPKVTERPARIPGR